MEGKERVDEENESKERRRKRGGRKETHICPSRSHNSHGCDYVQLPREAGSKIDERRLMEEEEDAGGTKGRAVLSCARGERERARGGGKVDIYAAQEWPCLKDHDGWKHFKPIDLNNRSMVAAAPATFLARVTSHPFVFPPRRRLLASSGLRSSFEPPSSRVPASVFKIKIYGCATLEGEFRGCTMGRGTRDLSVFEDR